MATDIALHWNSVSIGESSATFFKIFLTALAVIDDLELLWLCHILY
jgi:Na+/H+ antiporter NhaA